VKNGKARMELLTRGMAWLDTGTPESLLRAAQFVHVIESRQGTHIACIEEIAFRLGYIGQAELEALAAQHAKSEYGSYLRSVLEEARSP
jgi:glucose-1-phosphate thymidylyltransferase